MAGSTGNSQLHTLALSCLWRNPPILHSRSVHLPSASPLIFFSPLSPTTTTHSTLAHDLTTPSSATSFLLPSHQPDTPGRFIESDDSSPLSKAHPGSCRSTVPRIFPQYLAFHVPPSDRIYRDAGFSVKGRFWYALSLLIFAWQSSPYSGLRFALHLLFFGMFSTIMWHGLAQHGPVFARALFHNHCCGITSPQQCLTSTDDAAQPANLHPNRAEGCTFNYFRPKATLVRIP